MNQGHRGVVQAPQVAKTFWKWWGSHPSFETIILDHVQLPMP